MAPQALKYAVLISILSIFSITVLGAEPVPMNENSNDLINSDQVHEQFNLDGTGYTAAMWGFGLAGNHEDLESGSGLIQGDNAEVSFHPTHVAGTLTGNGALKAENKGIAPASRLVSYNLEYSSLSNLFSETAEAEEYGSVVSHNSWAWSADNGFGNYDDFSEAYDRIAKGTAPGLDRGMSVVFPSGNYRNDVSKEYNTVSGTGSSSKNSITVGAVDSQKDMTSFSSWGPTDDGRIKPDLVANGNLVKSTKPGNEYGYKRGTSVSAPAVSGAVVLVNQAFEKEKNSLPSPSMVKAILIHTSEDLSSEGPDYRTGWGLPDVKKAVELIRRSENVIEQNKVGVDAEQNYVADFSNRGESEITLVWSDPEGGSQDRRLINDLDLEMTDADGKRLGSWTMDPSSPEKDATLGQDHINTVEQVPVPENTGKVYVNVSGEGIGSSQKFSLISDAEIKPTEKAPVEEIQEISMDVLSPTGTVETSEALLEVNTSENVERVVYSLNGQDEIEMQEEEFFSDMIELREGENQVTLKGFADGQSKAEDFTFTLDSSEPEIEVVSPERKTYRQNPVSFKVKASTDVSRVELEVSGRQINMSEGDGVFYAEADLGDDFQTAEFTGYDDQENSASDSVRFLTRIESTEEETEPVTEDTEAPDLKIVKPEGEHQDEVPLEFTTNESLEKTWYSLDGKETTIEGNTSLDLENGSYSLKLYGEDAAGNTGEASTDFSVELLQEEESSQEDEPVSDEEPPEITVVSPESGETYDSRMVNFTASFNEEVESAELTLNRKQTFQLEKTGSVYSGVYEIEEGLNTFMFMATDTAGNFNSESLTVTG